MPAFSEHSLAALKNEYALAAKAPSNLRGGNVPAAATSRIFRLTRISHAV
jgi:hypothetical protein